MNVLKVRFTWAQRRWMIRLFVMWWPKEGSAWPTGPDPILQGWYYPTLFRDDGSPPYTLRQGRIAIGRLALFAGYSSRWLSALSPERA